MIARSASRAVRAHISTHCFDGHLTIVAHSAPSPRSRPSSCDARKVMRQGGARSARFVMRARQHAQRYAHALHLSRKFGVRRLVGRAERDHPALERLRQRLVLCDDCVPVGAAGLPAAMARRKMLKPAQAASCRLRRRLRRRFRRRLRRRFRRRLRRRIRRRLRRRRGRRRGRGSWIHRRGNHR